jgi:hypothetical protein
MLRKVGLLTLLLALTLLATGVAQAKPLAGSLRASESHGVIARVWSWIAAFFQGHSASNGPLSSVWAQDGSHIDPNGGH